MAAENLLIPKEEFYGFLKKAFGNQVNVEIIPMAARRGSISILVSIARHYWNSLKTHPASIGPFKIEGSILEFETIEETIQQEWVETYMGQEYHLVMFGKYLKAGSYDKIKQYILSTSASESVLPFGSTLTHSLASDKVARDFTKLVNYYHRIGRPLYRSEALEILENIRYGDKKRVNAAPQKSS